VRHLRFRHSTAETHTHAHSHTHWYFRQSCIHHVELLDSNSFIVSQWNIRTMRYLKRIKIVKILPLFINSFSFVTWKRNDIPSLMSCNLIFSSFFFLGCSFLYCVKHYLINSKSKISFSSTMYSFTTFLKVNGAPPLLFYLRIIANF